MESTQESEGRKDDQEKMCANCRWDSEGLCLEPGFLKTQKRTCFMGSKWEPGKQHTEQESEGRKDDQEKLRYDLVPVLALEDITRVLTYGAKKYAPENWKKVEDPERRYIAAAMRHIEAFRKGETIDPESGLPHLAHASCCLMFILEVQKV